VTPLDAIILGALQGATEFLPVSSDGHLILAEHLLGIHAEPATLLVFNLLVHVATVVAIAIAYREDIVNLLTAAAGKAAWVKSPKFGVEMRDIWYTPEQARAILGWIALAVLATGIVHLGVEAMVGEAALERFITSPLVAGFGFLATSALLVMGERARPGEANIRQTGARRAVTIGLLQWLAVLPGWSRSGTTIATGTALGLNRLDAAKFSFLMAIPLILLAFAKEAMDSREQLEAGTDTMPYLLGFVTAMGVGVWAIQFLIRMLRGRGLLPFAYYTAALGIVTLLLVGTGTI